MRRRKYKRRSNSDSPGEDSFLDIVANLVGVLIILVVVVGANAGSRIHEIAISEVDQAEHDELKKRCEAATKHAFSLERDNHELEDKILVEQNLASARKLERDQWLVDIQTAEQLLESQKQKLSDEHQQVLEQSTVLASLRDQYRAIDSQFTSLNTVASNNETIEHYPTPIAKTVFSEEMHFRLRNGRLVYVPMTELVELMRDEWKQKARKLEVADETTETVGPIGDFRLQYHLRAEERRAPIEYGAGVERVTSFTRFIMVPVNESIGVALEDAFNDGSEFRSLIGLSAPEKTTVSVWVYPDSFAEFNQLKKWLYERGFKTACWPLSKNNPISGGPSGYRSTAQ